MIKLLIVDDDIAICDFLKEFFTSKNYEAFIATKGDEALSILREKDPQIMLLDLKMPGMMGLEVLKQAREFNEKVKIIMITGMRDEYIIKEAKRRGASDYITKPFNLEYLEKVVLPKLLPSNQT